MSIIFYVAPMSSATPVACALAELGVPHERVTLDLSKGDQKKPEFLALNPNGKVPTLVVDGKPLFEALAIMIWLGERFGVAKGLWPREGTEERGEALSFSVWAYVTYAGALGRKFFASGERLGSEYHNAAQAEHATKELEELQSILEARLARQPFLLGASYSLADLIVASVVGYGVYGGVTVGSHPRLQAWLEGFQARPAFKASFSS